MPKKLLGDYREKNSYRRIVYFISIIGSLGGLLFGLDQGFIANALPAIQSAYHLDLIDAEKYSALLALGGVIGALVSGISGRILGRKRSLILAGFLFSIAIGISAMIPSFFILCVCRFIIGCCIGLSSLVTPLYLAETAPASIRGSMGTLFQFMITIGIFLISLSNVYIASMFVNSNMALPLMFAVVLVFALCMFVGSIFLPESPRWLMLKGRRKEAEKGLRRTMNTLEEVDIQLREITETLQASKGSFIYLIWNKRFIKVLVIGIVLQMFQQLVGINMMIYYAPTIFAHAGMKGFIAKMTIPTVNMLFTIPAIWLVEKWGRKKLLYTGAAIMLVSMLSAGVAFQIINQSTDPSVIPPILKTMLLLSCIVYIFGFAFSWGPVAWLVCSEIFPLKGRESGMTVTTMVNWTFAGLVMRYSLSFMKTFGDSSVFYLFAAFCLLAIVFVAKWVPETKGITLEELEIKLKR